MKTLYTFLLTVMVMSTVYGQKINEFYPNPPGSDPTFNEIELKGTPNTSFNYWLVSIENDISTNVGVADRVSSVSGTFDSNGLDVVLIPDLEDPSFTLVLSTNFSGSQGDDLDTNNDGIIDNVSGVFGTVIDAIGIADSSTDNNALYGESLGGVNILFNGFSKPELVFRDGLLEDDWFVVVDTNPMPDQTNYTIHKADGTQDNINDFDIDPTTPTFSSANPSKETQNIENFYIDGVRMYPNPNTSGTLNIKTANNNEMKVSVFDILGKQVLSEDVRNNKLDVSQLKSGLYIVKIIQDAVTVSHKLVID